MNTISITVNGPATFRGSFAGHAVAVGSARHVGAHRHEVRLRQGAVRRLHGPRGW